MSECLLIIDMQASFDASLDPKVQRSCIREIKKAMREQAPIVFVEYSGHGSTISELTDVVEQAHYKKVHHVLKHDDDGSDVIVEFLRKKHLPRSNLSVVGVNSNWCVRSTVAGLTYLLKSATIKVIADACNCNDTDSHRRGLNEMRLLNNVKILRDKK